jgi:hypothetical protein
MPQFQNKVLEALIEANDWMTVQQLCDKTGIDLRYMYTILKRKGFAELEKERIKNEQGKKLMCYRIPKKPKNYSSSALDLAKQHKGVFGQLFWI